MVATFLMSPAPGHQLAAAMLWLTAIGAVATVVAPRLIVMRDWSPSVRRKLRNFRRTGKVGGRS
jgi:hypothetical protein